MTDDKPYTNSELTTAMRCDRQHVLIYRDNLVPKTPPPPSAATSLGTEIHLAAQRYYEGESPDSILASLYEDDTAPGITVAWTFEKYLDWLETSGADAGRTTLGAERAYTRTWNGMAVTGLVDLVQFDEVTHRPLITDFKTTGMHPSMKARELEYSDQGLHYLWLMQDVYPGINTVDFRIIPRVAGRGSSWDELPVLVTTRTYTKERIAAYEGHMHDKLMRATLNRQTHAHPLRITPTRDHDCPWRCAFADVCLLSDERPDLFEELISDKFVEGDVLERYREFE